MELKLRLRVERADGETKEKYEGVIGLRINGQPEIILSFTASITSYFEFGISLTLWKSGKFFLETLDDKLTIYDAQQMALLQLLSNLVLENVNAMEDEFDNRSENSCEGQKIFDINDGAFEQYLRQVTCGVIK